MGKDKIVTEEHHRRQRSRGGSSAPPNISYVKPELHRAWTALTGNMNAFQICDFFNHLPGFNPEGKKLTCHFINGKQVTGKGKNNSKNKNKIAKALDVLFGDIPSYQEKVEYINNVWLDPSYHLYIEE